MRRISVAMSPPPAPAPMIRQTGGMGSFYNLLIAAIETLERRDRYPRVDKVSSLTVSASGTDQDFTLTGTGFGTNSSLVSAKVGGLDMVVQTAADTTVTLRLASGAGLTAGEMAVLHLWVDGVSVLPVQLEVVA